MVTIKNIPKSKPKNGKQDAQLKKDALSIIKRRSVINLALALVAIIVVLFGATIIYINSTDAAANENAPGFLKPLIELNNRFFPKPAEIAAIVNGEEITFSELDERYSLVPQQYRELVSKQDILAQMMDEKILLQQAKKLNLTASQEEVNDMLAGLLEQNQISREEFESAILARNMTMQDVEKFYSNEIVLTKLVNSTLLPMVVVSDTDIKDYYFRHPEEFYIPESVNVSHILICHNESERCVSNLTKEEAFDSAEKVRKMINSTNFAEIALNKSNEPAAVLTNGNLGWVSRESPFDQTFMNATFNLSVGEVSAPVETVFGYHLIKVFEKKNESTIDIETVYDQINQSLSQAQQKDLFEVYISGLRNESVIVNMINKTA